MAIVQAIVVILAATPMRGWCGWTTFTTGDGLTSNVVTSIVDDLSGTIWCATRGGVSRYDGATWSTHITVSTSTISATFAPSALEDHVGNLWFATGDGVSRYDGFGWSTYQAWSGELPGYEITAMIEDRSGNLWFGGGQSGGVSRFDGSLWRVFRDTDGLGVGYVTSILEDRAGNIWVGHIGWGGAGLSRYDGSTWRTFSTADGLASNNVRSILEDSSGRLWFATDDGVGVARYDGSAWATITTADGLAGNRVSAMFEDRAGSLWFATDIGVSRYDGSTWATFDVPAARLASSILEDRSGNLWVGACRYDGSVWRTFTTADGLAREDVRSILEDQSGNLWFGTGGGISRFDHSTWRTFSAVEGLAGDNVACMHEDREGVLWFGTAGNGVSSYDGAAWTTFTAGRRGLAGNYVWSILEDRSGNLWFGTDSGASRYDGSTWRTFTTADGLADDNVTSIAADQSGSLWFGTSNGLSRFDGTAWQTFGTAEGLPHPSVLSVFEDRSGTIWCGTAYGVGRYDGSSWSVFLDNYLVSAIAEDSLAGIWCSTVRQGYENSTPAGASRFDGSAWTSVTMEDGLADNLVNSILADRSGNLWFGTGGGGGSRYDGGSWRSLDAADGLGSNVISSILEDRSGNLWFGTDRGVSRYEPDRVAPQTLIIAPPPKVTAASDHALAFSAFGETDRIEFSYRLDGGAWSEWSRTTSAYIIALSDGLHLLEARSRDYLTNTDSTPAQALFEVDAMPPAPILGAPAFGEAVRGTVELRGSTADSRFVGYRLEIRPEGAASWNPPDATLLTQSDLPVSNGPLGIWDTSSLRDGLYQVRLSVSDSLGLTGTVQVTVIVDNYAPFADETAPAKVAAATGGDIYTTNGEFHLYFPPRAFREDALVTVVPIAAGSVPDTLVSGAVLASPGFDIAWGVEPVTKPARLTMQVPAGTRGLVLYHSPDGAIWTRLGGTVSGNRIEAPVMNSGRYALFSEAGVFEGPSTLSTLSFTPRVFSPTGTFADQQVGIGFTLGRPGPVTVRIYARNGRLIREVLSGESLGAGSNLVRWDGRDRNGDYVTDGLYLVTVEALGHTAKKPLAVVK